MKRDPSLSIVAAGLSLLLPGLRACAQSPSGESHAYFSQAPAVSVPLQFKDGILFVKASLNGKPVTLTLDNVWERNALTVAAAQRLSIISANPAPNAPTEGVVDRLQIGNFTLLSDPVTVVPSEGWPDDGLLGTEIFRKAVVRLDFRGGQMTLLDPAVYQPPPNATALPLTILSDGGALVEATVDGVTGRFAVRAGDWPALKLEPNFIAREHLREPYKEGVRIGSGSNVDEIRAEKIDLGAFCVADLVVELPKASADDKDKSAASDGQIGNDLLKNFIVTFDYPHRRLYLESPDKSIRRVKDIEAADLADSHANDTPEMVQGRREVKDFRRRFSQLEFTTDVANAYKSLSLPDLKVTVRPFDKVQSVLTQAQFLQILHAERPSEDSLAAFALPSVVLPLLATIDSSSDSRSAFDENLQVTRWRPDKIDVKPTEITVISSPSIDLKAPVAGDASETKRVQMKATFRSVYHRTNVCPFLKSIDLVGFAMSIDGKPLPDAIVRDMYNPAPAPTNAKKK